MADNLPQFLSEDYSEPTSSAGRETFLVSVLTHIAVILVVIMHPEILFSPVKPVVVVPPQEVTQLVYQPPPKPQPLRAPPVPKSAPPTFADQPQQKAQQNPDAMREPPQQRKITPPDQTPDAPVQPRIPQPAPREQSQQQRDLLADSRGGGGGDKFVKGQTIPGTPDYPTESKDSTRQPGLQNLQMPKESPPASLQLPTIGAPGKGTDALLREMAKQRASGQGPGTGMGLPGTGNGSGDPNFNLPGPQILSDTMGVDFDPYLLRVYLAVRRNWYSVIPEIARLGKRGRVVLQFHILRNGGVQELMLEDASGTPSMDSAAMSSIRLSDPFPPLPSEFPGADVRLRFVYFYNMSPQ
jgi:TonB family protein